MKRSFLPVLLQAVLLALLMSCTHAKQVQSQPPVQPHPEQGADSLKPAYLRFPTVPPFEILEVDSATTFSKADLKKNHEVLLMYFSPDCEHCQHQTEDLLRDIESFKKIQIVMATYQPFESMKQFYQRYQLNKYSANIHVGRDSKFILPPFYRMGSLPYLALYDKKGNLITTFEGNQKADKILSAFGKDQ